SQGRIDVGGCRIRHQQHVALVDVLEATNAGAVEADTVDEQTLGQLPHRNREVLGLSGQVHEAQVDDLDPGVASTRQHLGGGAGGRDEAAICGGKAVEGRGDRPASRVLPGVD